MISKLFSLIFIFISFSFSAFAEQEAVYTIPIDWQKVELQKEIEDKLNHGMQSFAPSGKFLINVEIVLQKSKSMNFGKTNKKGKKGKTFSLDKLGLNRNSKAFKKAISIGRNSIFSQIKNVNVRVLLDPSVRTPQITQIKTYVTQTIKAYTGKNSALSIKKSPLLAVDDTKKVDLQIAKLNSDGVKLVAEAIQKSNDKIAQAIAATQGVELKNIDGEKKVVLPQSWQEWVVNFKLPLGIVIATVLLLMGISGFKTFEGQKVSLMAAANAQQAQATQAAQAAAQNSGGGSDEPEESEKSSASSDVGLAAAGGSNGDSGFDQFRKLAEEYPDKAMYLIKLWLNMNTQKSQQALAAITKMVPVETLIPITGGIEDSLKLKFKKATSQALGAESIAKADSFIIEQLVDIFLVDTIALPDEVKDMLADATLEELALCVRQDTEYGTSFVNVLQTAQVGRLFTLLSEDEVAKILEQSLNFNGESVQYLQDNLAGTLEQVRQDKQKVRVPIIDKSLELIRQLGAEGEHQVFTLLISSGDQEQVKLAAKKYYPAQLFMKFPSDQIRTLLSKLSTTDRARLIFSRPADEQKLFMAAVGNQGRLKEIIDSELKEIQSNDKLKKQIQKNKTSIWNNYIKSSRAAIKNDSTLSESAETVLSKWFKDNGIEEDSGDANESLAA